VPSSAEPAPRAVPVILAAGVTRAFGGVSVLRGVDLAVEPGELLVLLGPNGAGKTTLLRTLATLLRPDGGRLELFGEDVASCGPEVRRRLAFVGHETCCYPDLSAQENLRFYADLFSLPDREARVAEALVWAGLGAASRRPLRTYSRGMQQRVALARAMLHRPDLMLLDEAFSGLDPASSAALADQLARLRVSGTSIVISTHDLERAATLATRGAILAQGRIVWTGAGPFEPSALAARYDRMVAAA